jgi:MFS family permease
MNANQTLPNPILKNLKYNMTVNILDGAFFGMALGFASYTTVFPLFVNTMTNSAILIGLIPAIHSASWQIPQLFMARMVARQTRFKPMVLFITLQERLPFLGLALVAWKVADLSNPMALMLTYLLLSWQSLGAGFTANAWQSMIAKIIPGDRRGMFFGFQASAGNLLASFSAISAGLILEFVDSPLNYTLCFLLASACLAISWFFLALTREPQSAPLPENVHLDNFWNNIGQILIRDKNFRWFLIARTLTQLAVMGFAFYIVYIVNIHGAGEAQTGVLTSVLLITQIFANPLMGWLGDRWSHHRVMELGIVAALFSAVLAWWAPSTAWFYPVVILAGVALVAVWTTGLSMTLEFGRENERPTYIGMTNTLVAPANIAAPFLGGWLADISGYTSTFLVAAIGSGLTLFVLHFFVRDPKKTANSSPLTHE